MRVFINTHGSPIHTHTLGLYLCPPHETFMMSIYEQSSAFEDLFLFAMSSVINRFHDKISAETPELLCELLVC